ncbi:hypothetical protein CBR_g22276 [Chara braunii]|uniref:Uncharacterized protein n=1 Tax=Chara braunii TaxID=69332 RepID=A0A388L2P3_CHABU|nr:hypothetical protein CBR_g22276 [Chara braunii]|eukprot:GBG76528.1 hypothetical protein CBR_g22276 [Chara braunii]
MDRESQRAYAAPTGTLVSLSGQNDEVRNRTLASISGQNDEVRGSIVCIACLSDAGAACRRSQLLSSWHPSHAYAGKDQAGFCEITMCLRIWTRGFFLSAPPRGYKVSFQKSE